MNDLASAQEQLDKAIARLETALAAQSGENADPAVAEALEQARADYKHLRTVADDVSSRIDDVIARLRTTLENELDG